MACSTGGISTFFKFLVGFFVSYCLPSIISAFLMVYYGVKEKKGSTYTIKLIGGSSVEF